MSLEKPRQPTETDVGVTEDGHLDYDELADLLGEHLVDREHHVNAEGFVIRPDEVEAVLSTLKQEAGFDHCSCVSAQEYQDRYESIYHLKKYADPTQELSVVVPTARDNPVSQTGSGVFDTAEWHEREAYDLVGIEYEGHPDLRRILLPETWQGHPLSQDFDQNQPQIVPLRAHANPLADDHEDAGNPSNLAPGTGSFSLVAWAKPASGVDWQTIVERRSGSGTKSGYLMGVKTNGFECFVKDKNGDDAFTTSGVEIDDGNWHHCVATIDQSADTLTLYVDNSQDGTADLSSVDDLGSGGVFYIGDGNRNISPSSWDNFDGVLDDVRYYSKALSASEVSDIYNSTK